MRTILAMLELLVMLFNGAIIAIGTLAHLVASAVGTSSGGR